MYCKLFIIKDLNRTCNTIAVRLCLKSLRCKTTIWLHHQIISGEAFCQAFSRKSGNHIPRLPDKSKFETKKAKDKILRFFYTNNSIILQQLQPFQLQRGAWERRRTSPCCRSLCLRSYPQRRCPRLPYRIPHTVHRDGERPGA